MWRLLGISIIVVMLLLASCNNAPPLTITGLCPTGPGGDWVVIQPETFEFIEGAPMDLGELKEFRFVMVASDGKAPETITSCASAVVFPQNENWPVYSTYSYHQVIRDIAQQSLVLDANSVGRDPVYVYFVGLDTKTPAAEVNALLGPAVQAIRQAIHQAVSAPQSGNLGQDITDILLNQYADVVNWQNIIGYGAFSVQPQHWLNGESHAVFSHNQSMYLRYELRRIQLYPTPPAQALSPEKDVIKNGDFEAWWREKIGVAPYWQTYANGQGHFGWYREQWDEAISKQKNILDKQSQLMEIGIVDPFMDNRVIAIHQSADVVANSNYNLTINAIMRSDLPFNVLNTGETTMAWGIDYQGTGNYDNVMEWFPMTLTEQPRLGSNTPLDGASYDESLLHFEKVSGNVFTGNSNRLTLFIRGMKVHANTVEVNFNVDNVSLVGPSSAYLAYPPTPTPVATPTETGGKPSKPPLLVIRPSDTPGPAVVTTTNGITATVTPTPQPTPQVPADALQFVTFLKNKYDEINGQPLPLEGVYLGNSPLFGRVVMINVNSIGLTMFSTQTAEMKSQYGKSLVSDVAAYFQGKDAVIQVTHQQFTKLDQEAAQCVYIAEALGCPNMEQATGYKADGSTLLTGKVKNGVQSVE